MTDKNVNPDDDQADENRDDNVDERFADIVGDVDIDADQSATDSPAPEELSRESQLEALLAERTEDLQRLQAEYVNYKRRVDRDRALSRQSGVDKVITDLMPVLDSIAMARQHGEVEGGFKLVVDELEKEVSHDVMRLALRGPLARDLREILAALRVSSDIERIGDYAANAAKRSVALNQSPPLPLTRGLNGLAELAVRQLREVLVAYRDLDADAAQRVRESDAELDARYTGLFRELLTYMMEDARSITPCTHLLFIAKNLERIGDHATNIAENVWFLVHGDDSLPPREKRDTTNTVG